MTVEIYPDNDAMIVGSSKFTAKVNGDDIFVYGSSRQSVVQCEAWNTFDTVEMSFFTIGTDEDVTIRVDRVAGPITAAVCYRNDHTDPNVTVTIDADGFATFIASSNYKYWFYANGDRKDTLVINSNLLQDTVPVGYTAIVYDGSQGSVAANECLVFEPGIYDLEADGNRPLVVAASGMVLVQGGAFVTGNFDVRGGGNDRLFAGNGIVSGEYGTPETITALPWSDQMLYNFFAGEDNLNYAFSNNVVRGITFIRPCTFFNREGINHVEGISFINPWYWNIGGPSLWGDYLENEACINRRSLVYNADDCIFMSDYGAAFEVYDVMAIAVQAACLELGFWSYEEDLSPTVVDGATLIHMGSSDTDLALDDTLKGSCCCLRIWVDGDEPQDRLQGRFHAEIKNVRVLEPLSTRLFSFENHIYPWGGGVLSYDGWGQIADIVCSDWVVDELVGSNPARIRGLNWKNAPHDISFHNMRVEGTLLTVRNWFDYVEHNIYPYNIRVGGRNVATALEICNTALGHIGNKARVTSVTTSDGSVESDHCIRLFPLAVAAMLEMHNWSWATAKVELTPINVDDDDEQTDNDDEAWEWRYEIPDDMVRAISILPDDSTNDYVIGDSRVPVDFAIKRSNEDDDLRIYTNQEAAFLRYIVREIDPNYWDSLFTMAVTWHLASLLAGPLIKGEQGHAEADRCLRRSGQYLGEARAKDSNERQVTLEVRAKWIAGRD